MKECYCSFVIMMLCAIACNDLGAFGKVTLDDLNLSITCSYNEGQSTHGNKLIFAMQLSNNVICSWRNNIRDEVLSSFNVNNMCLDAGLELRELSGYAFVCITLDDVRNV